MVWFNRVEKPVSYLLLKYLHIIGAVVVLGTGMGIAFFMVMAHRSRDTAFVARTASVVVLADNVFTATAIVVQPVTGYLLLRETGTPISEPWVLVSLALYLVAGSAWLPVVWVQTKMRDLAKQAAAAGEALPDRYHRLFRLWFALGIPGFGSVMLIFWLMVARPSSMWT